MLYKGTTSSFLDSPYFSGLVEKASNSSFPKCLAELPAGKKKELVIWADLNLSAFAETLFKEKRYLSVDTSQDVVYNTIQLNQAERTARQAEFSLKKLRDFIKIAGHCDGYYGISAMAKIGSYDFVRKDDTTLEKFEMHVPFDAFDRFISADITNQELIDASIIMMDGSRMKVNLAEFSH